MLERPDPVVIDAILEREKRLGRYDYPDPQDFELLAAEIRWLRVKGETQGHTMTRADKDARAAMYREMQDHPDGDVEDASDKMSMKLQEMAPRKMEGIRMVKPGPAINLLFDEGSVPVLCRIETDDGHPIGNGEWSKRDVTNVLRVTNLPVPPVPETKPINIVFDGPPGLESGRLVEIETDDGKSIRVGNWAPRLDGSWSLRITELPVIEPKKPWDMEEQPWLRHTFEDKE